MCYLFPAVLITYITGLVKNLLSKLDAICGKFPSSIIKLEAYIGAVFVDPEYGYKEVERFFEAHILWFFEEMSIYDSFANNHRKVTRSFFLPQ